MFSVSMGLRSCWFSNSICCGFSRISFSTGGGLGVASLYGLSVGGVDGGPIGGIIVCMSGGILGEVISRPGGLGGGPGCGGGM